MVYEVFNIIKIKIKWIWDFEIIYGLGYVVFCKGSRYGCIWVYYIVGNKIYDDVRN